MTSREFLELLSTSWPPGEWSRIRSVVAVSGGADSVALLCGLLELGSRPSERLLVAHFNHGWRGTASDEDEQFVLRLCRRLGVACRTGRPLAGEPDGGADGRRSEASARNVRYEFLTRVARQFGARYLVTAHTAEDQAETILHRILRGTGLAGLAGIPRTRRLGPHLTLLRPLLAVRRDEILEYLAGHGQEFREDASNEDCRWTRNRIRHDLLPQLATDYNPRVVEALLRLGDLAGQAHTVLDEHAARLAEACCCERSAEQMTVNCDRLSGLPLDVQREVLISLWRSNRWPMQAMSYAAWDRLARLAGGGAQGTVILPGRCEARRDGSRLTIRQAGP